MKLKDTINRIKRKASKAAINSYKKRIIKSITTTGGGSSWESITGKPSAVENLSGTNTGDHDLSGYSLTSHNHTGVYQPVATGTPDGTKYLRDDNTWQAVTGGSGLSQQQVEAIAFLGI